MFKLIHAVVLVVRYHVVLWVDTNVVRNEQGFSKYQIMWHCDPDNQNIKLCHYNNRSRMTHDVKLQEHFSDKIQLKNKQKRKE